MSDQQPPAPGPGEPEYLGSPGDAPRTGPRWGLVGGAAVAVVATVAAGGWGLAQLMAAPGSPADAVPASALAYLSLDLDPSASQKIAAIRTLQKFPALEEELDLDARDDVRRWAFEAVLADSDCEDVTYADDVEPWLGNRMAVAAVPDQGATVSPLFLVQVDDQDAATAGLTALADCADEKLGVAFVDDYALLMEKQADADSYAAAAEASPLAEDADFGTWTDRAGDPGVVNAYVAADAPARMADLAPGEDALGEGATELYRNFEGAAGVIRFQDGRIEAEVVTKGMPAGVAPVGEPGAPSLAELPGSTAAAFTMSFRDGWLEDWVGSLGELFGGAAVGGTDPDLWQDLEAQTGLQLPEDLEALLGDGLRVSVDGSVDVADLDGGDVPRAPVGVRINGDETEIVRVLDRLRALVPEGSDDVLLQRAGDGFVVLGLDPAYVDRLTTDGGLGDDETFAGVVPEADRVSGGVYVNFDAEDWATRLAEQLGDDPEVVANVAPLDALGLSSWLDDEDVQHGLFRLSTD
ncbi:MAG TPA: DUF3352 domain-containing protein [Nocardioides sp.]|uniref:DUF3352 domain-containing protein n=1 Tax=Nocardioides sp. TaxID=35761 RepID=UPI002D7FC00F|nr:DUF3352 domain-containing protein [Nocardioides sp.]HET6653612.1 DUF3352 domain-containing protein [Nocardioides sp.]